MYIGRAVIAGRTQDGIPFLGYRLSSRSFPNRRIVLQPDRAVVLPTADAPPSDNPYIAYNCLRWHGSVAAVANGSHVDPIVEKAATGYPLRDALALCLLSLDYEHDDYGTPRIAAGWEHDAAWLAMIARGGLLVQSFQLDRGEAILVATYGVTTPTPVSLPLSEGTPESLAQEIYGLPYDHPVASLVVLPGDEPRMATWGPRRS